MASTTATHGLRIPSSNSQQIVIEENSLLMKVISCIPLIGTIPSYIQEIFLANKIRNTAEASQLIELINVKNQYKIANVIRNLITAALIVAGIAFGILGGTLASGAISTVLLVGVSGFNIYRINQNNKVITELQSTGFRPGMIIG